MRYKVFVDDNFHRWELDESTRDFIGEYETAEDAIAACKALVDIDVKTHYEPGMTADKLYRKYSTFGEEPFIVARSETNPTGVNEEPGLFLAWDYAKERCQQICSGTVKSE